MRGKSVQAAVTSLVAAALLVTFGTAGGAQAATFDEPADDGLVVVANTSGGIREDIAAANGYEVVTAPDGTKTSVPVTPEAIAFEEAAAAEREAAIASGVVPAEVAQLELARRGTVDGNCGSSWVETTKGGSNSLYVTTGYVVFGAVVTHSWRVNAVGFISSRTFEFSNIGAPNAGVFNGEAAGTVIGVGVAVVPVNAYAVLRSGQLCNSGGPTDSFN